MMIEIRRFTHGRAIRSVGVLSEIAILQEPEHVHSE
jgi:hypothetical protein